MSIQLNVFQEIFLVAFSILYGIMLQTYFGFNAFPWGKILRINKEITGLDDKQIQRIRWRLLSSVVVLNIFPFAYAVGILSILSLDSFIYDSWTFECYLVIFLSFWAGLAVFGFQTLYGKLAISSKEVFPKNIKWIQKDLISELQEGINFYRKGAKEHRPDPYAFLIPFLFYIGIPIVTLFVSSFNPLSGFSVWLALMAYFLFVLAK